MPTPLLADLTSRDPQRVWASACAIIKLRNDAELRELVAQLPALRQATSGLNLGGALRANSTYVDFAIQKLEFYQHGRGCMCQLYLRYDLYDPLQEQNNENTRIISITIDRAAWTTIYACHCTLCGAR